MRKLLLFILFAVTSKISPAQTMAPDFTAIDCTGNLHTLYGDISQGKVIVLCWVEPCGGCIGPSLTAYNVVQSYASQGVLFYLIDDFGDTPCETVSAWATNNNIGANRVTFSHSHIVQTNYGGIGMPHIVVIGKDSLEYFNELNEAAGNATTIQSAINSALGIVTIPPTLFSVSLIQNPSPDNIVLRYTLPESNTVYIRLVDALGKKITSFSFNGQAQGENEFVFDVRRIPTGCYFLLFNAGTNSRVMKILVSH